MSYNYQNFDYQQFYQQMQDYQQKQMEYNENKNRSLVAATQQSVTAAAPPPPVPVNNSTYYKQQYGAPTTVSSYDYSAQAFMPALVSQPGYAAQNSYYQQYQPYADYYNGYQQQQQQQQPKVSTVRSSSMIENGMVNTVGVGEAAATTTGIVSRSCRNSRSQILDVANDEIAPEIEAACEQANGAFQRRQPVIKRQVITMPAEPGQKVQQVVRRLSTPVPDVVERVFIMKPQREVVNLVIERPATPPVQYKDRTIYGKQRRPIIAPKVVRVAGRHYQQDPAAATVAYQANYTMSQDYNNNMITACAEHNYQVSSQLPAQMTLKGDQMPQQQQQQQIQYPHHHHHHHHHHPIDTTTTATTPTPSKNETTTKTKEGKKKPGFILAPVKYENQANEYKVDQPYYMTAYQTNDGNYTYPQQQQQQQQPQQQETTAVANYSYPQPGTYQITPAPMNAGQNPYSYFFQQ